MKDVFGITLAAILVVAVLVGVGWVGAVNGYWMTAYFQPRYEQVRRNTFEQSKAYNQGMIQELQNMQFQWAQADDEHKAALADLILHRAADYDEQRLPPDLYTFIQQLKRDRTAAR